MQIVWQLKWAIKMLAIIPFDEKSTFGSMLEDFQNDRVGALNQILHASPIYPPPAKCPASFSKKNLASRRGAIISCARAFFVCFAEFVIIQNDEKQNLRNNEWKKAQN